MVKNSRGNVVNETGIFDAPRIHFEVEGIIEGWDSLGIETVTTVVHRVDEVLDAL